MSINNEFGTRVVPGINRQDNLQEIESLANDNYQKKTALNEVEKSNQITLSLEGKLNQEIDTVSDKIDDVLLRHISSKQKQELNDIYKKLDNLFSKDKLTKKKEKSAEVLFEQVHLILESSLDKLTTSENKTLDKLATKMDILTEQLDKNHSNNPLIISLKTIRNDIRPSSSESTNIEMKGSKKTLTVAEINALSTTELNKLSAHQLKKLNARQLNKLSAYQLNRLEPAQIKQLNANNVAKLNQSQRACNKICVSTDFKYSQKYGLRI